MHTVETIVAEPEPQGAASFSSLDPELHQNVNLEFCPTKAMPVPKPY
jgi:hypothetical protein